MYINSFLYRKKFFNINKNKLFGIFKFIYLDFKMSVRCIQRLWMINSRRQFQTSILRLSPDVFHVKDDADFQKQVLDSKKPFIVDFHASW
jgi:hypothetical protein